MADKIQFKLNGKQVQVSLPEGGGSLLWGLRAELGLTGAKYGCGEGHCGACTVVMDGNAVRSCVTPLQSARGSEVLTIEGLAQGESLHPLQAAFMEHSAFQCGYCTPGMIMNAHSLLRKIPRPTTVQIVDGMENNLCRCGAHTRIIRAVEMAAKNMLAEK